jgi:hypothetical protein
VKIKRNESSMRMRGGGVIGYLFMSRDSLTVTNQKKRASFFDLRDYSCARNVYYTARIRADSFFLMDSFLHSVTSHDFRYCQRDLSSRLFSPFRTVCFGSTISPCTNKNGSRTSRCSLEGSWFPTAVTIACMQLFLHWHLSVDQRQEAFPPSSGQVSQMAFSSFAALRFHLIISNPRKKRDTQEPNIFAKLE